MGELFHVDAQFLKNALDVFENPAKFEQAARSRDPKDRARNVANLVDALDLCNMLVLGDRIVFDNDVGGGRDESLTDQIGAVGRKLADPKAEQRFYDSFSGVQPANKESAWKLQLAAASGAAAFFSRLSRCATNLLDLFYLPHTPPKEAGDYLVRFVDRGRQATGAEIEEIQTKKGITGRRFYAAMLSEETAFRALCQIHQTTPLTDDVLAVLFTNFRLRLAEQRSLTPDKVLVGLGGANAALTDPLVYIPSMGRRDFTREFTRFVRYGRDPKTRPIHAFDDGLREFVMEEWEGVGCQVQLSEQRMIPIVVASIIGSSGVGASPRPETLLVECLRWRDEHQSAIGNIRQATREFDALGDDERKAKAGVFAAEILRAPSTAAARNQMLYAKFANKDQWAGMTTRMLLNPGGALAAMAANATDWVRQHFTTAQGPEFKAAVHLSEAARPLLAGFGPQLRQCLVDIFGGTVIDARNPAFDPDRFEASA